ncbi:hypothetical protein P692DRAFT_20832023 [Suillus brevipes Sb2]|nr:hypothetical protein P692DRAFT_20832023 [Suillus brevipes Sb2]
MRFSFVLAVVAALAVSISATEETTCAVVCVYDRDCSGCIDSSCVSGLYPWTQPHDSPAYRSPQCAPDSICVAGCASAFTL